MSRPWPKPDPLVTVRPVRTESDPSLLSRATRSNGPSKEEPALITSTWTIGWQTPTLMLLTYALALAIALTHLMLFRYIDGKEADGPNRIAPQGYITTASNVLANAFGLALRTCLAVAFVQHLWHLLRVTTMKVSIIESLFCVRANPFLLCQASVIRATPLLCLLAIVILLSQVVTSFPPGAISITSTQKTSFGDVQVPTFNASFMGNGSGADANAYSLITLSPSDIADGFVSGFTDLNKNNNLMNRLARQVLVAGESFPVPSPCGGNCSYILEFEGPYMACNTTTESVKFDDASGFFPIYAGKWKSLVNQPLNPALRINDNFTTSRFNTSTLFPLQANGTDLQGDGNSSAIMRRDNTTCVPMRAVYTVNNTYLNNVQAMKVSARPVEKLINLVLKTKGNVMLVPGFRDPRQGVLALGTAPANWSASALAFYRDNNHMAVVSSLVSWLNGTYEGFLADNSGPATIGPGAFASYQLKWNEEVFITPDGVAVSSAALNGTVIDSTRFNSVFGRFSPFEDLHVAFNVTQDIMNEYLFNMTISMMMAYGTWNTTANATQSVPANVYTFSQPLNLVLPYFITLLVSLPFVVIGCLALFRNGVAAMDGSFTQIITTSTGSAILDRAAAGGCLGGNESMPQELKDLKIRFGEFVGRDDPGRIKRAGFGVDGEVKPLEKGERYGIARWI